MNSRNLDRACQDWQEYQFDNYIDDCDEPEYSDDIIEMAKYISQSKYWDGSRDIYSILEYEEFIIRDRYRTFKIFEEEEEEEKKLKFNFKSADK